MDIALNFYYQYAYLIDDVWSARNLANLAFNYAAYAVLIFLGRRFKPQSSFIGLLGGGLLGGSHQDQKPQPAGALLRRRGPGRREVGQAGL